MPCLLVFFRIRIVEISYDEHSGANGIITRLEVFLNIVNERKVKKVQPSEKINLPTEPLSKAVAS